MDKPTKEQRREFWEWCKAPYRTELDGWDNYGYPPIDLNNLFQWAVPKVKIEYRNWKSVLHDWVDELTGDYEKDALALFWALDGVGNTKAK